MKINTVTTRNTIRATIAVIIAMILAHFMPDQRAYWIPMTTVVLVQISLGASIRKSKQRILGTLFGVMVGVMLAVLFHHHTNLMLATIPLFVLFIIYTTPFSYALSIFLISTMLIMILAYNSPSPWHFAISRTLDTVIGIIITIMASMCLFPSWAKACFYLSLFKGIEACNQYFEEIMQDLLFNKKSDQDAITRIIEIEKQLTTTKQQLDDYTHEPRSMIIADGSAYAIVIAQERMHSILSCFQVIRDNYQNHTLNHNIIDAVNDFCIATVDVTNQLIYAMKTGTKLPKFDRTNHLFFNMRDIIENNKDSNGSLVLLYRNFFTYVSELKHITQAVKQLRTNMKTI